MRNKRFLILPVLLIALVGISFLMKPGQAEEPTGPKLKTYLWIEDVTSPYLPDGATMSVNAKVRAVDGRLRKGSNIEAIVYHDGQEVPETEKVPLFGDVRYLSPFVVQMRMYSDWVNHENEEATTRFICTATIGTSTATCYVSADGFGSLEDPYTMTSTTGAILPEI